MGEPDPYFFVGLSQFVAHPEVTKTLSAKFLHTSLVAEDEGTVWQVGAIM